MPTFTTQPDDAVPDWLSQQDADEAAQKAARQSAPLAISPTATPDWLAQQDAAEGVTTPPAAPPVAPVGHAVAKPSGNSYADAYNFLRTAATKGLSSLLGTVVAAPNPVDLIMGKPTDPEAVAAHATNYFANKAFNAPVVGGPEYQPQTMPGKYAMAAAETAIPAAIGAPGSIIPNAIRGAAAGVAAKGADDFLPGSGWLGPLATTAAEFLARKAGAVVAPSLTSGAKTGAGRVANELPPVNTAATPAIPNLRLTTGQVSGDPQWLQLDDEMGHTVPAQSETAANLGSNQAVIHQALDGVAGGPGGADAAVAQTANLTAAQKASKATADAAWQAVPPDVSVNTAPLKTALDQHVAGVTANGDDDLLPTAQITRIMSLPDNAPLSALQARRSRLVADASDAANAGQSNSARIIGKVATLLGNHIDDDTNIVTGTAADLNAYKAARAATKARYDTFGDDNTAGAQLPDITSGKIAPESALARVLPAGAEGTGTQALSRLKMGVGTGTGLDPARDYLVGKLHDAVGTGPDAFDKVLDNYGYAFNDSDMFTSAQQQMLNDASAAMRQTYAKAPAGTALGSPTFTKLSGPSFAHAIYGSILGRALPLAAKMGTAGVASVASKAIGAPGVSEIGAQLFGGEAAGGAVQNAMSNARNSIFSVLDAARKDQKLAAELQRSASAGNLTMSSRVANMLKVLGLSEAQVLPGAAGQ